MTKTGYTFSSQYIAFSAECEGSVSEIPAYTGTP